MDSLNDLTHDTLRFPTPPNIALRLLETLRKSDCSINDVAGIIQYDPALAVKVLMAANSNIYTMPSKTARIESAVTILGAHVVKNIALSFSLVDNQSPYPENSFDLYYFWRRAITAATSAEFISHHLKIDEDDVFVTALLQDLGALILFCRYPAEYSLLISEKNRTRIPLEILEKRKFGFTHQELGSEFLKVWGLPENVSVPIRYHHDYRDVPDPFKTSARILYLSNAFSSLFNDSESCEKIQFFAGIIRNDMGISDQTLESLVDNAADRVIEVCSMFEIPYGDMQPASRLLQEANEELSSMNLSYETLLARYKMEKEQSEKLAKELQEANLKLMEVSVQDPLTGLYNRCYAFAFLDSEIERVTRYGGIFSILIFDIDHFKKVNDTFGHISGDLVLKAIGNRVKARKRSTDIIARYGGEEFLMVLPQTDRGHAVAFAERLRTEIEHMETHIGDTQVKVTVSIGVATYNPQASLTVNEFVSQADGAMYKAKRRGRNRVVAAGCRQSVSGAFPLHDIRTPNKCASSKVRK